LHRFCLGLVFQLTVIAFSMSISKYFAAKDVDDSRASVKRPADSRSTNIKRGSASSLSASSKGDTDSLSSLREEWRVLYAETLPSAARQKAPEQSKWFVLTEYKS
jgi:hypothetical protein